ncbi:hypothetical protein CXB51_015562 [Gossypium anomalum]|uniref:Uncharacterized protein n=1 Tax=Gossypium anomalum TaxID=47600 RepID=A0A8J5YU33_9ROSI|nr:hypothetical protein CXB51_015562 [Gossypium anomalum]
MESFYFPALNLVPKGKIFSPENLSQASIPMKKRQTLMARMRRSMKEVHEVEVAILVQRDRRAEPRASISPTKHVGGRRGMRRKG